MNDSTNTPGASSETITLQVTRVKADRSDNRRVRSYGVHLVWVVAWPVRDLDPGPGAMTQAVHALFAKQIQAQIQVKSGNVHEGKRAYYVHCSVTYDRPSLIPADPWTAVAAGIEEQIEKVARECILTWEAHRVEKEARTAAAAVLSHVAGMARVAVDGDFAARFAALRAEREAARQAALGTLLAEIRTGAHDAELQDQPHAARVLELVKGEGVSVRFGAGPFAEDRVSLGVEALPS